MYLRNLFLASALVAASLGSASAATEGAAIDIRADLGGQWQQDQAVKPHLAGSRALIRPVAEAETARRGEAVPAMVSTVQEIAPTPACRMPGSPTRSALPYCAPASTTLPSSSQPVMVW